MANPPKLARLKLLAGNPGMRGISGIKAEAAAEDAVRASAGPIGDPPDDIDELAKEIWTERAKVATWLTSTERDMFTAYCLAASLLRTDPNRLRVAAYIVKSVGSELGFSPISRTRMRMGDGKKAHDPAAAILGY